MISLRSQTPKGQRARATIIAAAEELLVTRGFHGTSMRDIAKAARVPLATVVYHFTRKERLYGAVLFDIADELTKGLANARTADDMAKVLVRWSVDSPHRVVLLLRELLDNPARVAKASQFPLAPFLLRAAELAREAGAPQPELAVLQIVGAVSYVVASKPTVDRIVGPARAKQMAAAYEADMLAYARRVLGIGEYDVTAHASGSSIVRDAGASAAMVRDAGASAAMVRDADASAATKTGSSITSRRSRGGGS